LLAGSKSPYRTQYTDEMLSLIDYLVDGEFVLEKKNISLKFRGSENQRILCKKDGVWVNSEEF
ncbi:4Fe-4S cluster-binding domain-containing protein, partial [Ruminococcus bicirculans (ex Wegman et al. 2014)]|uniref:4Fe-4S cluster-binding domain-containing protein n=3 Tax=Ruminococcus TaxID=1263 RepID=UPI003FD6CDBB